MKSRCTIDTYATLVDKHGRFIDSIGRVVEAGEVLKISDGCNTKYYRKKLLLNAIRDAGLELKFLPPNVRLPTAPTQLLEQLYTRIAEARLVRR